MAKKPKEVRPRTAGELRRLIASKKLPWTVDSRLGESDQLPKYARGGEKPRKTADAKSPVENVADLIRQHPPTNPFLRERWIELKLLPAKSRGHSGGSTPKTLVPKKEKKP